MKKKSYITCVLFFLVIAFFSLGTLFSPKEEFNEIENRWLAKKPIKFNLSSYLDKSYTKSYENYINDNFIMRTKMVSMKYDVERFQGKSQINDVIKLNDQLIQRFYVDNYSITDNNTENLVKFSQKYPNLTINFMLAPTAQAIFTSEIPAAVNITSQKTYINYCFKRLTGSNITNINILGSVAEAKKDYIYFRTDHHWTSYGAYLGYTDMANKLNFTPLSLADFSIEYASNVFKGTLYSLTLDEGITPDVINYYYRGENQPKTKVKVFDGRDYKEYNSVFFREYLDKKDKYMTYLGGNFPLVEITSDVKSEKSLLLIKDSYANALVPFLIHHYSKITIIDPRFLNGGIENLTNPENYTDIIYVGNVMSFANEESLNGLTGKN